LETLLTWKTALLKWTRQTAWDGEAACRGGITSPKPSVEPLQPPSAALALHPAAPHHVLLETTAGTVQANYIQTTKQKRDRK